MKNFFINSVLWVALFSLVKFFLNLKLASLLLPSDYGIILMPLIFFSFLDLFLEGGFHSGIIKFNPPNSDIKRVIRRKLRLGLVFAPAYAVLQIIIFSLIFPDVPSIVILAFMFISLIKISNYFFEAKLIGDGFYIKTEIINFLTTTSLYLIFLFLIPQFKMEGFYYLSILYMLQYGLYGSILFLFFRKNVSENQKSSYIQTSQFAQTRLQSSLIFTLSSRIDELSAAFFFNVTNLGIYSRIKELGIMLGTFSSKIISRPWYYIACNLNVRTTKAIYIVANLAIVPSTILLFSILQFLMSIVINFLGSNWSILSDYSFFMVSIFLLYFLSEFSLYTLLALGKEKQVLIIDRAILVIRIICYVSLFSLIKFFGLKISIDLMLYLEVSIRAISILMQYVVFLMKDAQVQENY